MKRERKRISKKVQHFSRAAAFVALTIGFLFRTGDIFDQRSFADVGALSKAVELALFYDAKLDVAAS